MQRQQEKRLNTAAGSPSHRKPGRGGRLQAAFLMAATLTAAACSSVDCPVQNTVYTSYGLHKAGGERDTLRDTLTITTTRRDGTDSVLLNRSVNTTSFELPISYTDPEDTLFFYITDTLLNTSIDTVYVRKDNYPHFESVDCNISFFHYITAVRWTRNAIDSIAVNKQHVDYDASTEHFHLYLKARP